MKNSVISHCAKIFCVLFLFLRYCFIVFLFLLLRYCFIVYITVLFTTNYIRFRAILRPLAAYDNEALINILTERVSMLETQ